MHIRDMTSGVGPSSYPPWRFLAGAFYDLAGREAASAVQNRDRPGPARGCALDLDRETRHGESGRGQLLEIVQLFDVAIADVAARLVAFPDQAGILGFGVFLRGIDERRVPAPAVDAGQPHAALQEIHRRLITHAAAGG